MIAAQSLFQLGCLLLFNMSYTYTLVCQDIDVVVLCPGVTYVWGLHAFQFLVRGGMTGNHAH